MNDNVNEKSKKKDYKRILHIIVADRKELEVIKQHGFKHIETEKLPKGIERHSYYYLENNDTLIILMYSRVGIANAASAMQVMISDKKPKIVYSFGSAGSTDPKNLLKTFLISSAVYGDVSTPWYELGQIPHEPTKRFDLFSSFNYKGVNKDDKLHKATIITTNSFTYRYEDALFMSQILGANLYDMETAAFAQIAKKNGVAFSSVKSVSDIIDIGKKMLDLDKLNENINKASSNAFKLLLQIAV